MARTTANRSGKLFIVGEIGIIKSLTRSLTYLYCRAALAFAEILKVVTAQLVRATLLTGSINVVIAYRRPLLGGPLLPCAGCKGLH